MMDYPHPLDDAEGRRHDRPLEGLRRAASATGTRWRSTRLPAVPGRHRRRRGARRRSSTTRGRRTCATSPTRTPTSTRAPTSGRTASTQADELTRLMEVRRAALDRIGENDDPPGAPMATIEEPLVPIYLYHRYAVESGGVDARRPGLRLRDARRRPHAGHVGDGGQSAQGARGAARPRSSPRS